PARRDGPAAPRAPGPAPPPPRASRVERDAEHDRRRAVVDGARRRDAPVDVVALGGVVGGLVALVAVAEAAPAVVLAAAVVVADHVVLAVGGVAAGADPGDRRHRRARRARGRAAAAARAQEAVDRAVAPVLAARGIALGPLDVGGRRRGALALLGCDARDRQQRQRRAARQRRAEAAEEAAPREPAREPPRAALRELVDACAPAPGHRRPSPARAAGARSLVTYSWIDATPRACASSRLSRCSRVFTRPFARTTPSASISTACGRRPTPCARPSS